MLQHAHIARINLLALHAEYELLYNCPYFRNLNFIVSEMLILLKL
jgi:hypothetical protein